MVAKVTQLPTSLLYINTRQRSRVESQPIWPGLNPPGQFRLVPVTYLRSAFEINTGR